MVTENILVPRRWRSRKRADATHRFRSGLINSAAPPLGWYAGLKACATLLLLVAVSAAAQQLKAGSSSGSKALAQDDKSLKGRDVSSSALFLSHLNAGPNDPLYTTYAANMSRAEYFPDAAYHLNYYSPERGVTWETQKAGDMAIAWRLGKISATATREFYKRPVIHRSYTDLAEVEYWPFTTIQVREMFVVWSSRMALWEVQVTNHDRKLKEVTAIPYYLNAADISNIAIHDQQYVTFQHAVDWKQISESQPPQFDPNLRDIVLTGFRADTWSGQANPKLLPESGRESRLHGFSIDKTFSIPAGRSVTFRIVRGMNPMHEEKDETYLVSAAKKLLDEPIEPLIEEDEAQYKDIPRNIAFPSKDAELAYWSAFNLVRQQMLPPEGDAQTNYYVFSREPTWSWGHDGQVFHESIVMQAYALMDWRSAQNSQRVFIDRQRTDGYIGYRVGPYVNRTFPLDGEDTSSAPFFNWTNWELYQVSHDRDFLQQAYVSGAKFADFILRTRNKDGDGFLEWGGNAMLECVRDELDVIWSLFGGTDASPKKVKSLDLTVMMVKETRSLAAMAKELGRTEDAARWTREADRMAELVRTRMWDEETGFFYNLARDTGTFTTKDGISMKRKEIIGFLPLWAGIATQEQAERLRLELTNPSSFWRKFGVPTLAANDPYFQPNVTKCCQWNGAVWLLWNYMVMRGLLDYGYRADAQELVKRNLDAVTFQLRNNHRFWESFSPDYTQLNSPKNYIWDAIIARMMVDLYGSRQSHPLPASSQ